MANGNPDLASVWDDCDILVAFDPDTATIPASVDTPFDADDWTEIGLLDGEQGVDQDVNQPEQSHRAWKVGVIKKTYQGAELTYSFNALEDNEVTEQLTRPNHHPKVLVAFEWREGDRIRREITRMPATVNRNGAVKRSETGLTSFPLTVTAYPDPDVDAADENQFIEVQSTDEGS